MTRANSSEFSGRARRLVLLAGEDDFDGWRDAARRLAAANVPAEDVLWQVDGAGGDLFAVDAELPPSPVVAPRVPREFLEIAGQAVLHADPQRFALLYALLLRLTRMPKALEDTADPLVRRVEALARTVRREMHKMRAFLRFREIDGRFVAWFEPEHHVVRANAGFFARRFAGMDWSILSPELSLHWQGGTLREGPGATRADAPGEDALEDVWKVYYASTFNPARLKVSAMLREMPRRYWQNMPEAALIAPLVAGAQRRESQMVSATKPPETGATTIEGLRAEADHCRRCPLWKNATQCVFGEGPADSRLMIVGEQPGDEEDLAGRPFVGPAGRLLDRALSDAGLDRGRLYVTNAVKHFKHATRGKRRLHQTPTAGEITACRWWLEQEIAAVRPAATLMLGATAIRATMGRAGAVGAMRGKPVALAVGEGVASYHPAYILRQPDRKASAAAYAALVEDLRLAAGLL